VELIRPVATDRFCAKEDDGFNTVGRGRRNRKRQGWRSWRQPSIDCQPGQPTNLTRTSELSSSSGLFVRVRNEWLSSLIHLVFIIENLFDIGNY